MALIPITHVYDTKAVIDATELLEGQILYTTDQILNKIYADVKVNGTLTRIEIGGTNEIDTVLDQESGHAISNSAVAKLAQTVHTNLLNPTLGTTTVNGVTCTANGDGTYTLNGTASADTMFAINSQVNLETSKTYTLVGCPNGGDDTTYALALYRYSGGSIGTQIGIDVGSGGSFTTDSDLSTYLLNIVISANTTVTNLTFKPMLTTDLSATYDDFVQYSGDGELNENVAKINANLTDIWKVIYPVGSIYMSVNSANPATLFGGTWSRIKDTFLLASGDSYANGATGGEASHTLTTAELPAHSHGLNSHTHGLNGHTHSIPALSMNNAGDHNHWMAANRADTGGLADWPYLAVMYGAEGDERYNYALHGGASSPNVGKTNNAGSHTHTTNASTTGGNSGSTAAATGNTTNTGSGTAHNNMPPYLAVYVWERTA